MTAIDIFLWLVCGVTLVPALVLFIECAASAVPRRKAARLPAAPPPRMAVLISAHNEELLIAATVQSVLRQLRRGPGARDSLLVVADNCDDRTAEMAASAGARVIQRHDALHRGKGYGLSYGVAHLKADPPDVLIVFDADIQLENDVIIRLAAEALERQQPIQAQYVLSAPATAGPRGVISTLAFIVKNAVRPAGLERLGLPCGLTGTGMAFPWKLIQDAPLASGHLVEDMELGLYFIRSGHGPGFCSAAAINGELPADRHSAYVQRTRWEHGHLSVICGRALPLLLAGIVHLRPKLVATALDLAVPPLALLACWWCAVSCLAVAAAVGLGVWTPAILCGAAAALLFSAILLACRCHARHLPVSTLLGVPAYVLWKIPLYLRFAFHRQTAWVRTERVPRAGARGVTNT